MDQSEPQSNHAARATEYETHASAPAGDAEVAASWNVGDSIADLYEVREVHGQGGMGLVYRVHHLGWGIDLAVKSPRPELFASDADQDRFVREAETWVSLGLHPHVCGCHYVRTLGGIPRVFAEYVDGGSLREWIDDRRLYRGGPRESLARVLDLAIQIAWGLAHAHGHGVVHQDVKPANVLVDGDGTAKVTDFGLARSQQRGSSGGQVAREGGSILVSIGGMTPAYASPEQVSGGQLGRRSDVWSFAVSVLEMVAGEVTWLAGPVAGAALAEYRQRGSAGPVTLPSSLAEILADCLRDDPAERPAGMGEVAAQLMEIYQRETGGQYGRVQPRAADLRADELNNRALSLLDLGRVDEARTAFEQARTVDPQHLAATFNLGLLRWRSGALRDDELVAELETVHASLGDPWQATHLLGQVHLERGDPDSARPLLEATARQVPDDPQVQADLQRARTGEHAISRTLVTLTDDQQEPVLPRALSADGRLIISLVGEAVPRRQRQDQGNAMYLWDAHTGRHLRTLHHPEVVVATAVSISDDGRLVLSGADQIDDTTLCLWDADTGGLRQAVRVPMMSVDTVCLGADGRFALFEDRLDVTVQVWDLQAGRGLHILKGARRATGAAAPSGAVILCSNGHVALTGGIDGTVRVWDLRAGHLLHTLPGHTKPGTVGSLSLDGRIALTAATDGTARMWDLETGRCLRVLPGDPAHLTAVALSADGRLAVAAGANGVQVWDVVTGRHRRHVPERRDARHDQVVSTLCLTPDGRLALTGGKRAPTRVWELQTGRCLHTVPGQVRCLCSDGRAILTGDQQGAVRVWASPQDAYRSSYHLCRPSSYAELARIHAGVEAAVHEAERAIAEGRFATAKALLEEARDAPGWERAPLVLDAWRWLALRSVRSRVNAAWPVMTIEEGERREWFASFCLDPDRRLGLSGGWDGTVGVWDLQAGHCLHTIQAHRPVRETDKLDKRNNVAAVCLGADGQLALSGAADGTVRVWDLQAGSRLHTLEGHERAVLSVSLSADGRLALSGASDGTVRVWDLRTGRCLRVLASRSVKSVCLSPDGRIALTGGWEEEPIRVWDLRTGDCLRVLEGEPDPTRQGRRRNSVSAICLSMDGRLALSGGPDGVRLWDVQTGQRLRVLEGHKGWVSSVWLSADGRFGLSGGGDGHVRVWDLQAGSRLHVLEGRTEQAHAVGLTSDGRLVMSAGNNPTLRVWELDWELAAREPADWDEAARPYLAMFLSSHTPFAAEVPGTGQLSEERVRLALTRRGTPSWTEADLDGLVRQLQYAGYGWLRPQGVRAELERMARHWQAPSSPGA